MKQKLMVLILAFILFVPFAIAQNAEQPADKPAVASADKAPANAEVPPVAKEPEKPKVDPGFQKALDAVKAGQRAIARIKDFTAIFYKTEWKKKQFPTEKIKMKWRRSPRSVYMTWIGDAEKGQETLWVKGWNSNEIKAHAGGFLKLINVNLNPKGSMAMKKSRHTVTEAGFDHTAMLIAKDLELAIKHPEWDVSITDLGQKMIYGAKSTCFEAHQDKKNHPKFYAYKAIICMHNKLKIPNQVKIWDFEDGKVRLIEHYGYENVKINVGLTDKDFDPKNDEYKF